MSQQAIQDLLNVPGVAGIALMDGRSRPYFQGVDSALNLQQREALSQGILQVIETTPAGFDAFEFQFAEHQVHIYKFSSGSILLVLTQPELVYSDYLIRLTTLKSCLNRDLSNSAVAFCTLTEGSNFSAVNGRSRLAGESDTPIAFPAELSADCQTIVEPEWLDRPPGVMNAPGLDGLPMAPTLQDVLSALNHLSQFTSHYLGTSIIVNYWRSTCPDIHWLKNFQVDRAAQFTFNQTPLHQTTPPILAQSLTHEEQGWIKDWVAAFMTRCTTVIRNFAQIVEAQALTPEQKFLLWD
jgi:hypothetical protein